MSEQGPFKGLRPYEVTDEEFFFGRERDIRLLVANTYASPVTVLYGPSGVGKSSLVNAGLIARLAKTGNARVVVQREWHVAPAENLRARIAESVPQLAAELRGDVSGVSPSSGPSTVVVLDQLEEYFLYNPDDREFLELLSSLSELRARIVLSVREDALSRLDRFAEALPTVFDNLLRLEPLSEEQVRDAIKRTLDVFNARNPGREAVKIESALLEEILGQLRQGVFTISGASQQVVTRSTQSRPIELPYLQLVLASVWDEEQKQRSSTLRLATLKRLGNAVTMVRQHIANTMAARTPEERELAAESLRHLVSPTGTKLALSSLDLAEYTKRPRADVERVLVDLAGSESRILRAVPGQNRNESSFEIFHDALVAPIVEWLRTHSRQEERDAWKRRIQQLAFVAVLAVSAVGTYAANRQEAAAEAQLLEAKAVQAETLQRVAKESLQTRLQESIAFRQALFAASRERLPEILEHAPQAADLTFTAWKKELPYKTKRGGPTLKYTIKPEGEAPTDIALITYYMDHETFETPFLPTGPANGFTATWDGTGCLTRIYAIVEYGSTHEGTPYGVTSFDQCELLGENEQYYKKDY